MTFAVDLGNHIITNLEYLLLLVHNTTFQISGLKISVLGPK
jgi:hypothetical protein